MEGELEVTAVHHAASFDLDLGLYDDACPSPTLLAQSALPVDDARLEYTNGGATPLEVRLAVRHAPVSPWPCGSYELEVAGERVLLRGRAVTVSRGELLAPPA